MLYLVQSDAISRMGNMGLSQQFQIGSDFRTKICVYRTDLKSEAISRMGKHEPMLLCRCQSGSNISPLSGTDRGEIRFRFEHIEFMGM